jgi:hypothetical protein
MQNPTHEDKAHLEVEGRGAVLIVRIDGGPHALFGLEIANQLEDLVGRVDRDPSVHAVLFTGTIPSGSSAMLISGGCKKGAPRSLRSADAAPPR